MIRDKTPLNTLEIKTAPDGTILLASPFLADDNTESGDRCLYTGNADGGLLWTDRCSFDNPWHGWQLRAVNGDPARFQLVHKVTGRCAVPESSAEGSNVSSRQCDSGNQGMIWNWLD
jgi:hypothetical protein